MPALLEELHHLIPSYSNAFFWTENDRFSTLYDENPVFPQIASVYLSEFYNRRESEIFTSFTQSMRGERGVQGLDDLLKIDKTGFYKHDFYNLIYRPLNYRHFIRIVLAKAAARWAAFIYIAPTIGNSRRRTNGGWPPSRPSSRTRWPPPATLTRRWWKVRTAA